MTTRNPYETTSSKKTAASAFKAPPAVEEKPPAPVVPVAPSRPLSEAMRSDLQRLAAAMKEAPEVVEEVPDNRVELAPVSEETARKMGAVVFSGTSFDNREVYDAIRARLTPMDIGDLVMQGRVTQDVPILPGKLVVTFRSLTGKDVEWVEERGIAIAKSETIADASAWVGYALLTLGIVSINGNEFVDCLVDGTIDEDIFKEKLTRIKGLEDTLIGVLMVNWNWFRNRIVDMYSGAMVSLKNG